MNKTCSRHKTYEVKRKPRSNCLICWQMWFDQHSGHRVSGKEIELVLSIIDHELEETMKQSALVSKKFEQIKEMHELLGLKLSNFGKA